jgi:16S rRNA A1518/A1519 N6-dimethyltransferase RsmA/KsgA/DIM1 with predicted DNA glycosylase/AP lyase activity
MEEWRTIMDYPDYEVSSLGQVRRGDRILKPRMARGYCRVGLCKESKEKIKTIHRLVAEAFLPNPDNKSDVDHIDRNRTNNVVDNLRWATRSENCYNKKRRELFGITYHIGHKKFIVQFMIDGKLKRFGDYFTIEEAIQARDYNLSLVR